MISSGDRGEVVLSDGFDLEGALALHAVLVTEGQLHILLTGGDTGIGEGDEAVRPERHHILGLDRGVGEVEGITVRVLPVREDVEGDLLAGAHLDLGDHLIRGLRGPVLVGWLHVEGHGSGVGLLAAIVDAIGEGGSASGIVVHHDLQLGAALDRGDRADGRLLPLHGDGEDVTVGVVVVASDRQHDALARTHTELVIDRDRLAVLLVALRRDIGDGRGEGLLLPHLRFGHLDVLLDQPLIHELHLVADHPREPELLVVQHDQIVVHAQDQSAVALGIGDRLADHLVAARADVGERFVPCSVGASLRLGRRHGGTGAARRMDLSAASVQGDDEQRVLSGQDDILGGGAGLLDPRRAEIGDTVLGELVLLVLRADAQHALGSIEDHGLLAHCGQLHRSRFRGEPTDLDRVLRGGLAGVDVAREHQQAVTLEQEHRACGAHRDLEIAGLRLVRGLHRPGRERGRFIRGQDPEPAIGSGDRHPVPSEAHLGVGRELHHGVAAHCRSVDRCHAARTGFDHRVARLQQFEIITVLGETRVELLGSDVEPPHQPLLLVHHPDATVGDLDVRGRQAAEVDRETRDDQRHDRQYRR